MEDIILPETPSLSKELKIPKGKSLYPFQIEAIEKTIHFLKTNEQNACYNACEMGLGKTVQAITIMNTLSAQRVLIICPSVMKYTWANEIKKWLTRPKVRVLVMDTSSDVQFSRNSDIVICSYALAAYTNIKEFLSFQKWDLLVIDESHMVKNLKAKRTQAVLGDIWKASKYKLAMSGTPFTNNVVDGFSLFHKMLPETFPNFYKFAEKYSYQRFTNFGIKYYGVKNASELSALIRKNFYIRYTKEEVLKDLPSKVYVPIILDKKYGVSLKMAEKDLARAELDFIIEALDKGENFKIPKNLASIRHLQGLLKVKPIAEFATNLLENEIPIVLFAYHRDVITKLTEELRVHKPLVITGDVTPHDRAKIVTQFQNGDSNLFIGQMVAAGTGITLTRSSTVLLAELDFSPAIVAQAVDRCHRISQKNVVDIYYFAVEDSIDKVLVETLINKSRDISKVVNN